MNIQRYKWPVIVAASLHGALFLFTPSSPAVAKPEPPEKPHYPDPPPREAIELHDPAETETPAGGGAVEPLPDISDVLKPVSKDEVFIVPITEVSKPIREVVKLPEPGKIGPAGGVGPGNSFGPPSIPSNFDLDRTPRAMAQPPPDYPYSMRVSGITGSVTVEFIVGTDGHVLSAEAVRWTHREFADPAVKAVLRWKFEPGTINGRKVRFRMAVPIEFNAT